MRKAIRNIMIAVNIAIGILWLASCYSYLFNPNQFWLAGLLSIASIYLLIALIIFLFFWLFIKPVRILISIVPIVLAWGPSQNLIQLRRSSTFEIVKPDSVLRVMSWNVEHFDISEHKKHPEIKDKMIELISTYSPDVTCFQEMVASDSFSNAINYLPYFSKKMGMKYQFYSYNRKLDFDNKHHFGIIIFSRYPIINSRTISYPPYNYNSIFQYVDIVKGNDTFRVFNIHLQTQKFDKKNRMYVENPTLKDEADIAKSKNVISKLQRALLKRKEQSDNIKREIDKSPYAVIICGDFNDVPNSYAYHSIGEGLQDVFTKKGSGIDRTFISISPTLRIDYVFCDKRFQVNQYRCLPKKMSDHFPVITDLFFNGKQLH